MKGHITKEQLSDNLKQKINNLSKTENLVTVMICNEVFDPNKPDTFFEKV